MLSFAPYFYRNILASEGGPIEHIDAGAFPIMNRPSFQASAYLSSDLLKKKSANVIYGSADGTGSSENQVVAEHMAVSEALERWAYRTVHVSSDRARFGFDVDRTSNGMAAYPGFKWQARRRAKMEALERWALVGWWDGQLPSTLHRAPYPDVGMVRIDHGQADGEVVVLYHQAPAGFVAYGHASGSNIATACARAVVELARCEFVLARHRARGNIQPITDPYERRCIHFSTPEGHREFLAKANSNVLKTARWRTVFDGEIEGPWSRWAKVWRHCVEPPTLAFLNKAENFFLW